MGVQNIMGKRENAGFYYSIFSFSYKHLKDELSVNEYMPGVFHTDIMGLSKILVS